MDVCVEIPQHGVIRSLNVHVSAALLVWEYTRQHLGQNPAAPLCWIYGAVFCVLAENISQDLEDVAFYTILTRLPKFD